MISKARSRKLSYKEVDSNDDTIDEDDAKPEVLTSSSKTLSKNASNISEEVVFASSRKTFAKSATVLQLFSNATFVDYVFMSMGTFGGIVTGGCLPTFCILFGQMLDKLNTVTGGPDAIKQEVDSVCILFVILGCINIVSGLFQVIGWTVAGERQVQKLRSKYVNSIISQDIGWFDTVGASELPTYINDLSGKVQEGVTRKVGDLIQHTFQFLIGFVAAFYLCWKLAIVIIAAFPLVAAAGTFMIRAVSSSQNETSDQYAKAGGLATESLNAVRTVTSLNAQPHVISLYREYIVEAMNIGIIKSFKVGLGNGLTFFISFCMYALGFWYGAKLIADCKDNGDNGCYSGGTIISVFFCVLVGASALGQVTPPLNMFFTAKAAAGAMIEVINRKSLINGLSTDGLKPDVKSSGNITIEDIIFAYPSRPDIDVCNNYQLDIKSGETVALCGPSGAGKSTIINLLLRFYDPNSGVIKLDGVDIKTLNIKWLRNSIGYVGQEPVLFAGSIADNISYGIDRDLEPDLTDKDIQTRIEEAAKLANAHDFIMSFPDGYMTDVGGNGLSMSGGQKQRIAIARALAKKPAILLLDEATSALDATSEKLVQQAIDDLQRSQKITTIIVAHRLSTIRHANKIAVINKGTVVELGQHDELVAQKGLYYDLVSLQMSNSEENEQLKRQSSTESIQKIDEEQVVEATQVSSDEIVLKSANVIDSQEKSVLRKKIWALIYPQLHWLILGLIGTAMVGISFPIWGLLLAYTQNMFYLPNSSRLRDYSIVIAIRFILLGVDCLVGYTLQYYCIGRLGHKMVTQLRSDLFESIFRREIGYFDVEEHSVGVLTSSLAEDTRIVHESAGETLANQLQAIFCLITGLTLGFVGSWKIALVILATFPITIASAAIRMKERSGQSFFGNKEGESNGHAGAIATALINMRTVSAFSMQQKIANSYLEGTLAVSITRQWRSIYGGIASGFSLASMFFTYALLFYYGSRLILNGEIGFQDLMVAILGLLLGALGLGQALNDITDQQKGLEAAKRIFDTIEESKRSPIDGLSSKGINPGTGHRAKGLIELKNVSFRYPTRPDAKICQDYNLIINPGEVVALVGPSGSGKSTIINLLLRFYDPVEGQILLDGQDISQLNVRWLRSQIGYVGQEPVLFSGSVAENIAQGRLENLNLQVPPLDDYIHSSGSDVKIAGSFIPCQTEDVEEQREFAEYEDIVEASKLANAHNFIMKFTQQYDTDVGEGSVMVSGGQKQRIAIARAIVKKPAILLLDEATSALDAASERIVQKSIDALQQSHAQTTIVIAHRLSTIKNADKIAVIDRGHVIELGRHDELLELNGLYAQLWHKQAGSI